MSRRKWFGRNYELADGTIVLHCEFCGNPAPEPEKHTCAASTEALLEEMEQRERDAWKDA